MTTTTTAPAAIAQPVYVDQTWHEAGDGLSVTPGDRKYRETDDPRVLAVIERGALDITPDGEVYAPAYWADYRGGWSLDRAGYAFDDDEAARAVVRAWDQWGHNSDTAARFLRAFHGITVHELNGPSQGDLLVILDTPAHRELTGGTGTSDEYTAGDRRAWTACVEGDVWGIGYATNPARASHDEPVDADELDAAWNVELESWGYFGEEWAREAALELDTAPSSDELDAQAAAAVRAAAPAAVADILARFDAHMTAWTADHGDDEAEPTPTEYERHDDVRLRLLDELAAAVRPLV